ncbi:hypothetical protein ADK54_08620 [Streptomyces sp. WM6378]|nr:hypothetical protein ADK54_08620 [Streptomyces sp. WM6378]
MAALLRDAARSLAPSGRLALSYRDLTRPLSYPKLRIGPAWLMERCRDAGLHAEHTGDGPRGLHVLTATKS